LRSSRGRFDFEGLGIEEGGTERDARAGREGGEKEREEENARQGRGKGGSKGKEHKGIRSKDRH